MFTHVYVIRPQIGIRVTVFNTRYELRLGVSESGFVQICPYLQPKVFAPRSTHSVCYSSSCYEHAMTLS